jgi:riboflavin biosynthesis pyrimidine reductase
VEIVEAGAAIFQELISAGLIDELELSITTITGGEDKIDIEKLLSSFSITRDEIVEGTRFISALKR